MPLVALTLLLGGLTLAGCETSVPAASDVVTTATTQAAEGPATPIAWVASPLHHSVCTPYQGGEVCAIVEAYRTRLAIAPATVPAVAASPRAATVSIRIDLRDTAHRAVSLPVFSDATRLTLLAQSPETPRFIGDQYAPVAAIEPHSGPNCAPAARTLVLRAGSSATACGSFRVFTAARLATGGPHTRVFDAAFTELTVGGFAEFASRFAPTSDADVLALEGPYSPPGWSTGAAGGQYDPFTSEFALVPPGLGSSIVTSGDGANLGYEVPPPSDVETSAQRYLCGVQAQDVGGEPYQCDETPENPIVSGSRIVLHLWLGMREHRAFTATVATSWIDVQYGCTRSGCSSERLLPSRPTVPLPRGCGSASTLVVRPTTSPQRLPSVLSRLPDDVGSFDRRALCEVYVVPSGSRMYEGGVSVRFDGLANDAAVDRAWHTTFFQLPWGYF